MDFPFIFFHSNLRKSSTLNPYRWIILVTPNTSMWHAIHPFFPKPKVILSTITIQVTHHEGRAKSSQSNLNREKTIFDTLIIIHKSSKLGKINRNIGLYSFGNTWSVRP